MIAKPVVRPSSLASCLYRARRALHDPVARISPAIIGAAFCWLAASGPTPALAQDGPLATAESLMGEERWLEAAAEYESVLEDEPENGQAWFRLGMAYQAAGQPSRAATPYRRAIDLGFRVFAARLRLARVLALTGGSAESIAQLDTLAAQGFGGIRFVAEEPDFQSLEAVGGFEQIVTRIRENSEPCLHDPKAREFDFWVGQWDVFSASGILLGTNRVEPILRGCVLLENWTNVGGRTGKSFNFFDRSTGAPTWRQLYVFDSGGVLDYTNGEFSDGAMRFEGTTVDQAGNTVMQRLVFTPIGADTVHQAFSTSTDGGETWTPGFFGVYVRNADGADLGPEQ